MSVLEICQLQVKPTIIPTDPSVLNSLIQVRTTLREKVTNTNSKFYQCIEDPSVIYVLGVWPTLQSHHAFLSSPEKSEILDPQQDLLGFNWMLHVPLGSMEKLPLDAPVMCIARSHAVNVPVYSDVVEKNKGHIVEATTPYKAVDGWAIDVEEGNQEAIMITGWESVDAHESFTARMRATHPGYVELRDACGRIDVKHAKNMERE